MAEKAVNSETQQLGIRIEMALAADVKVLAVRQRRRFKGLVGEPLRDLLQKYQTKKGFLPKGKN